MADMNLSENETELIETINPAYYKDWYAVDFDEYNIAKDGLRFWTQKPTPALMAETKWGESK